MPLNEPAKAAMRDYIALLSEAGRHRPRSGCFPPPAKPAISRASILPANSRSSPPLPGCAPREGEPARAPPRFCQPSPAQRRRPAGGADPARPCRHFHDTNLYPCAGATPQEPGARSASRWEIDQAMRTTPKRSLPAMQFPSPDAHPRQPRSGRSRDAGTLPAFRHAPARLHAHLRWPEHCWPRLRRWRRSRRSAAGARARTGDPRSAHRRLLGRDQGRTRQGREARRGIQQSRHRVPAQGRYRTRASRTTARRSKLHAKFAMAYNNRGVAYDKKGELRSCDPGL